MIILNTNKYSINLIYELNFMSIGYGESKINLCRANKEIEIIGDIREIAIGMAIFVQGTLETLIGEYRTNDIINEAFNFDKDGKINCNWNIRNIELINNFIDTYNNIYTTITLLKD